MMVVQITLAFHFLRHLHSFSAATTHFFCFPIFKTPARQIMAHDKSSPLAGILMTAFFGIISTVLGVVTMYQVHSIWVKYHHQRHETPAAGAFSPSAQITANIANLRSPSDIELRDSVCLPATEEWQETPETSLRAVDQAYANPHRHPELLPPNDGINTITTRCLAGDEGTFDLALGVISRFSSDSSEGDWGNGIQAPPSTPESEKMDETYEI